MDEKVVANKWFLPLVWCAKIIGEGVENGNLNVSPDYSKSQVQKYWIDFRTKLKVLMT